MQLAPNAPSLSAVPMLRRLVGYFLLRCGLVLPLLCLRQAATRNRATPAAPRPAHRQHRRARHSPPHPQVPDQNGLSHHPQQAHARRETDLQLPHRSAFAALSGRVARRRQAHQPRQDLAARLRARLRGAPVCLLLDAGAAQDANLLLSLTDAKKQVTLVRVPPRPHYVDAWKHTLAALPRFHTVTLEIVEEVWRDALTKLLVLVHALEGAR